jgi:hypothetical protein
MLVQWLFCHDLGLRRLPPYQTDRPIANAHARNNTASAR